MKKTIIILIIFFCFSIVFAKEASYIIQLTSNQNIACEILAKLHNLKDCQAFITDRIIRVEIEGFVNGQAEQYEKYKVKEAPKNKTFDEKVDELQKDVWSKDIDINKGPL